MRYKPFPWMCKIDLVRKKKIGLPNFVVPLRVMQFMLMGIIYFPSTIFTPSVQQNELLSYRGSELIALNSHGGCHSESTSCPPSAALISQSSSRSHTPDKHYSWVVSQCSRQFWDCGR